MNARRVLQRSWQIVWQYKALWILGMVLALTAANTIYLGSRNRAQEQPQNIKIKLTADATLTLPGEGLTIDLTDPRGARVFVPDGLSEREDPFLTELVGPVRVSDVIAIGIEIAVLILLIVVIGTIARYVTETAVIRMVDQTEATGTQLTLRQGLRLGWSARAGRLFLIDLLVGMAYMAIVAVVLSISVGSIALAVPLGAGGILFAVLGVLGLLGIAGAVLLGMGAVVSLVIQPVRRACAIDGLGVFDSVKAGVAMLRRHLKDVGITWVIWIGIRILWAPVGLVAAIFLAPFLLVSALAGTVVGVVPAAIAAGIAAPFVHGITVWIIGAIAGLPVFVLVLLLPLLFVSGLVEIYKSSLWTLAYRELRGVEGVVQIVQPSMPLAPANGAAD